MSEEIVIRRMRPEDTEDAARLERESFTVPWSEELIKECLNSPFDKVWVLLSRARDGEERLCAYCNFRVIAGEGELMRIAVFPDARGRGYARKLMEILASDASKTQVSAVTLEVRASNLPAINLYKSCGFEIEAVRRQYYTKPVEDALIMWNRKV